MYNHNNSKNSSSKNNTHRQSNKSCSDSCFSMFNWGTNQKNTNSSTQGVDKSSSTNKPPDHDDGTRVINYDQGTLLFKAIEERQWKSILSRISMSPHEVSTYVYRMDTKVSDGFEFMTLPLHAVLKQQPPTIIVSAIIAAYPRAIAKKCDGQLPLHVALTNGASLDVIQTLIVGYPKALDKPNSNNELPSDIFEEHERLWWKDDEEKNAISKLLHDGIENIVLNESNDDVKGVEDKKDTGANTSSSNEKKKVEELERTDLITGLREEGWLKSSGLTVIVIGASGDLAKKKTYPSLLRLFHDNLLPKDVIIWGFARSAITHIDLRDRLKPFLEKVGSYSDEIIDLFLERCFYQKGKGYGDEDAYQELAVKIGSHEDGLVHSIRHNRLFYFAIPPNVFQETGVAIKQNAMAEKGWTRVIIEKPFGRDLQSCEELLGTLSNHFEEDQMFRIDHYLGKEMVQNLLAMRFGNSWLERLWNRDNIQCVILTFKEPFGTDGRGGYFDKYGIIRDIIQNHLLQVLSLLAMEPPSKVDGTGSGESIRDAKVQALSAIPPITLDDCFLGQYEGYTDDPTIENKDTNTPTFAMIRCFINTPRWAGVPFLFKAGKAMNERKADMRVQFKDAPAASFLFESKCPRNELVMRLQPNEAIYMKTNVKTPGFSSQLIQKELEVNYDDKFLSEDEKGSPDAYTRLILDVLRGKSATFVREDELRRAWEIFTPVLHQIEKDNVRPKTYSTGSRGPRGADDFVFEKTGYVRNEDYVFQDGSVVKKGSVVKSNL